MKGSAVLTEHQGLWNTEKPGGHGSFPCCKVPSWRSPWFGFILQPVERSYSSTEPIILITVKMIFRKYLRSYHTSIQRLSFPKNKIRILVTF